MTAPTETPSPATCPGCAGPTDSKATTGPHLASNQFHAFMRGWRHGASGKAKDGAPVNRPALARAYASGYATGQVAFAQAGLDAEQRFGHITPEREQLFARVRARVAELRAETPVVVGISSERGWLLSFIAHELGLSLSDGEALIDAAKGWPS